MDMIDIHTHVLPRIDDGAKDWDMCMQMLIKSSECGVKKIIATPHYLPWKKNADPEKIRARCRQAQEKLYEYAGISMDIYPGNEIYYHMNVLESLRSKQALTLADSRYVLMEFSTEESFSVIQRAIQNLREAGYKPIIAHVERIRTMRKPGRMEILRDMGALFQMNAEVLEYGFFSETGRWAKKMLAEGEIHFMASDMHNPEKRPPLSGKILSRLEKKLDEEEREALLWDNACRILK